MSDNLTITGQVAIAPAAPTDSELSGDFAIKVPINYSLEITQKLATTVILNAPGAFPINMGTMVDGEDDAGAHVLGIRSTAEILVRLTSYYDTDQVIAVSNLLILSAPLLRGVIGLSVDAPTATTTNLVTVQITAGHAES